MAGAVAGGRGRFRADVAYLRSAFALRVAAPCAALAIAPVPRWTARTWRHLQEHRDVRTLAADRAPMRRALRSADGWRAVAYHLLAAPLLATGTIGIVLGLLTSLVLLAMPLWMWAAPGSLLDAHSVITAGYASLLGLLGLAGLLALVPALARVDEAATRRLLGASRSESLARRLDELAGNRRAVLEAADAERRRIERDLHDGAQQRLVALSVNLGLAAVSRPDLPEPVRRVLVDARRQADAALADLTGLVRGLHPPILEDRGLVPALSSLAADSPLPVTLVASDIGRPPPAVEAVAYFVVAEAVTNAVKHAGGQGVVVHVVRTGDQLIVAISDDGRGGADASAGTGLAGLGHRVASVDGRLSVSSPAGGPTTIEARLPCGP